MVQLPQDWFAWNTDMAVVLLFWNTKMNAVTPCKNAIYVKATRAVPGKVRHRVVCRQFNAE